MRLRIRPRPPEYWLAFAAATCYVAAVAGVFAVAWWRARVS